MGRKGDWSREILSSSWKPQDLLNVVSGHCCSLAEHILTLPFGVWDCFARSLALNICDLKPSVGWKGSETTLCSSVKRDALKGTHKGTGILHWIISYRKESCVLNPLDWSVSHSLPATLCQEKGSAGLTAVTLSSEWSTASWKSSGDESQLSLCSAACEQRHVMGQEGVKVLASFMEQQAFTADENCQSLVELCSLSAWQTLFPVTLLKRKKNLNGNKYNVILEFQTMTVPNILFLVSC